MKELLYAPKVSNCFDDKINYFGNKNGVQIIIYPYAGTSPEDTVTLYWDDFKISRVIEDYEDMPLIYDVSQNFPTTCLVDGIHSVKYIVTDKSGNTMESSSVELTVSTKC